MSYFLQSLFNLIIKDKLSTISIPYNESNDIIYFKLEDSGISGGGWWGNGKKIKSNVKEESDAILNKFNEFINELLPERIQFVRYDIESSFDSYIQREDEGDFYGNYTNYKYITIDLNNLYNNLLEDYYFENFDKEDIINLLSLIEPKPAMQSSSFRSG